MNKHKSNCVFDIPSGDNPNIVYHKCNCGYDQWYQKYKDLPQEYFNALERYWDIDEQHIPLYIFCIQWAVKNKMELPKNLRIYNGEDIYSKEFLELYKKWSDFVWDNFDETSP